VFDQIRFYRILSKSKLYARDNCFCSVYQSLHAGGTLGLPDRSLSQVYAAVLSLESLLLSVSHALLFGWSY